MTKPIYDVVGIGNAIVDVLSKTEDAFLKDQKLEKGTMMLIDEERAEWLYQQMGPATECSGGSVANSMAGLASLGARGAFIGKVKDDQLGSIFRHDMRATGIDFDTPAAKTGKATARCLIFVTPDAQRTMNTFIGACADITPEDIDENVIAKGAILYVEGYLWDQENAKNAIRKGLEAAQKHGRKIAFSLSDKFCVDRHREQFLELIDQHLDIVFANEQELLSLTLTDNFDAAVKQVAGKCDIMVITRSEKGSLIITRDGTETVPAEKVAKVVDTTGAGDLFAAGFLYGFSRNLPLKECAQIGNRCAARIIQQMGARTMTPLKDLAA